MTLEERPVDALADFEEEINVALVRNRVISNTPLDGKQEHQTAFGSNGQNRKKRARPGKSVYGRYALRNHLRSRLREKLSSQ
jgi:hypothetical protein